MSVLSSKSVEQLITYAEEKVRNKMILFDDGDVIKSLKRTAELSKSDISVFEPSAYSLRWLLIYLPKIHMWDGNALIGYEKAIEEKYNYFLYKCDNSGLWYWIYDELRYIGFDEDQLNRFLNIVDKIGEVLYGKLNSYRENSFSPYSYNLTNTYDSYNYGEDGRYDEDSGLYNQYGYDRYGYDADGHDEYGYDEDGNGRFD